MRRTVTVAAWMASLAAALWFLHLVGTGDLATPPGPRRWPEWINAVGPDAAIVAILRILGIALGWYLVLGTVAAAIARSNAAPHTVALIEGATPRFLRQIVGTTRAMTVSAAALTIAVSPLVVSVGADTVLPVGAEVRPTAALRPIAAIPTITLERLNAASTTTEATATLARFDFQLGNMAPAADVDELPVGETWIAQTGDHLWLVAHETLFDAWGRQPSEAETSSYWRVLIEVNRGRLADPANPDLIFPGQTFVLPAAPPRP